MEDKYPNFSTVRRSVERLSNGAQIFKCCLHEAFQNWVRITNASKNFKTRNARKNKKWNACLKKSTDLFVAFAVAEP